jgi:hypothetical protein
MQGEIRLVVACTTQLEWWGWKIDSSETAYQEMRGLITGINQALGVQTSNVLLISLRSPATRDEFVNRNLVPCHGLDYVHLQRGVTGIDFAISRYHNQGMIMMSRLFSTYTISIDLADNRWPPICMSITAKSANSRTEESACEAPYKGQLK